MYKVIIRMQRVLVGDCNHEVTVKKIANLYHVRVLLNGEVNQEATCTKDKISYTAKHLLRMEDKCGNISEFASAARQRL
jgi:hypothetical protein